MPRQRRSGAQQRAYKAARYLEAKCRNERIRRPPPKTQVKARVILDKEYKLFQQLQGSILFLITLHKLTDLYCRGGRHSQAEARGR
jgi:hypothetical protein